MRVYTGGATAAASMLRSTSEYGSKPKRAEGRLPAHPFDESKPWDAVWTAAIDDGKFWNHSQTPNTGMVPGAADGNSTYALRDIAAGEELLDDYLKYEELEWFDALVAKHGAWVPTPE